MAIAAAGALLLAARKSMREPKRFFGLEASEKEFEAMRQAAHEEFMDTIRWQGYWCPGE